jgi:hypothetical protein
MSTWSLAPSFCGRVLYSVNYKVRDQSLLHIPRRLDREVSRTYALTMDHATGNPGFSATTGDVLSLSVEVDYGPSAAYPSVAGIWVGSYSRPGGRGRIHFSLILQQKGKQLTGVSIEMVEVGDRVDESKRSMVSDWHGTINEAGLFEMTKEYRGWSTLQEVDYDGQLDPTHRAIGGSWTLMESMTTGSFVMYRTTKLPPSAV